MTDPAFYVLEKLTQAIYTLATGRGRIQERLAAAALDLLPTEG
jgi:hypothetical protein